MIPELSVTQRTHLEEVTRMDIVLNITLSVLCSRWGTLLKASQARDILAMWSGKMEMVIFPGFIRYSFLAFARI